MNINLNNFLPTIYESSLNKIYKDYPGWEKTTDYLDGLIRIKRCDTDGDKLSTRIPNLGYQIFLAPDPIAFAEHLFEMKYRSVGLYSDMFTKLRNLKYKKEQREEAKRAIDKFLEDSKTTSLDLAHFDGCGIMNPKRIRSH